MDIKNSNEDRLLSSTSDTDSDSSIHTDGENASQDFAGIFSNKFSNISLIHSSFKGAMDIYAATRYGKRYALKGLKTGYLDDPVHNMCMIKEFEIGITLDHPNIRRTLGLENVEGLGERIILEYIDGTTLSEILSEGSMTPEQARLIAKQIAEGLTYLHNKQICHRDLKPDNILISYQGGNVKLIDFNLSDRDDYVVLKQPAGSKRYMAPEQSEQDATPTPEADIYSLGVIAQELADVSGSQRLARAAKACMNPDPGKRRRGIQMIADMDKEDGGYETWGERILESEGLTYVLSGFCILLAVFIIYSTFASES